MVTLCYERFVHNYKMYKLEDVRILRKDTESKIY
jgi:hypothetical protein